MRSNNVVRAVKLPNPSLGRDLLLTLAASAALAVGALVYMLDRPAGRRNWAPGGWWIPMKQILFFLLFAVSAGSIAQGEAQTGTVRNEQFLQKKGQAAWKTIAVLPFTGPPQHARVFAEFFSVQLLQQQRYVIISPAITEIELNRRGSPLAKGIRSFQEARAAGRLLDADAVIMGSVGLDFSLAHGEGVIKTKLIDTATGELVADITQTSPPLLSNDQHEYMTAAARSAAGGMLSLLRELSGEPLLAPTGTGQGDGPGPMPNGG